MKKKSYYLYIDKSNVEQKSKIKLHLSVFNGMYTMYLTYTNITLLTGITTDIFSYYVPVFYFSKKWKFFHYTKLSHYQMNKWWFQFNQIIFSHQQLFINVYDIAIWTIKDTSIYIIYRVIASTRRCKWGKNNNIQNVNGVD